MGHEMHILEGFILDSNPFGESGRILKILTKEYGVMSVVATGVRELHSKMRSSLDVLQLVTFEYVEGREVNRLTGIHENGKRFAIFSKKNIDIIQMRRVISNVVNFILRTVVGETHNDKLWNSFLEGMELLDDQGRILQFNQKNPKETLKAIEIIWLIKILVSLGYWEGGLLDKFSQENFTFLGDSVDGEKNRKDVIEKINNAIKSTHL